jgi:hypothetical protein
LYGNGHWLHLLVTKDGDLRYPQCLPRHILGLWLMFCLGWRCLYAFPSPLLILLGWRFCIGLNCHGWRMLGYFEVRGEGRLFLHSGKLLNLVLVLYKQWKYVSTSVVINHFFFLISEITHSLFWSIIDHH